MEPWSRVLDGLSAVAAKRLFFVGGAPRSGTTWVQQILDFHPEISCLGEGLFQKYLAGPLDVATRDRRAAVAEKNTRLFAHTGGYPLPAEEDADFLLGAAILADFRRRGTDETIRAIGEKTPENIFLFPRLKRIFPGARLIAVARDPRDILASAWHLFGPPATAENEDAAKHAFIRAALPSLEQGARAMLDLEQTHPRDIAIVTYELLRRAPELGAANMFRFLGVSDAPDIVAACVARASFQAQTGGRAPGDERKDAFLRKGVAGGWTGTLTPAMNETILAQLGWMFPRFGWRMSEENR